MENIKIIGKIWYSVDYLEKYIHIYLDLNSAIVIPKETMKQGDLQKFAEQAESMIERLS